MASFICYLTVTFALKVPTPQNGQHTQTIRRQQPTNYLSMFDHFKGLALKGLSFKSKFYFMGHIYHQHKEDYG